MISLDKSPVLVIMAAGMGSRYGGLKQAEKMTKEGDMLIDFSLFNARKAGFKKVVLIIKREHRDIFKSLVDNRAGKFFDIQYVYQELLDVSTNGFLPKGRKKPWGTGHAIYCARYYIDGPFAVINADDYYGPESFNLAYQACLNNRPTLIGYKLGNTVTKNGAVTRGVCKADGRVLTDIVEQKGIEIKDGDIGYVEDGIWHPLDRDMLVSMNFWVFPRDFLDGLPKKLYDFFETEVRKNPLKSEFLIPEIVGKMIENEGYLVDVLLCNEIWFGVTYKEDKPWVEVNLSNMKKKGLYPDYLWG